MKVYYDTLNWKAASNTLKRGKKQHQKTRNKRKTNCPVADEKYQQEHWVDGMTFIDNHRLR